MSDTRTDRVAPLGGRRLWTGLWLAPLAWAVGGLAGYLLVARSCEPGPNGLRLHGVAWPALGTALLSALMLAAAGWSAWLAWTSWRRMQGAVPPDDARLEREAGARLPRAHGFDPAWGRVQFVAFAGLLGSALFVLGLVYFVVPTLLVNPCVQSH